MQYVRLAWEHAWKWIDWHGRLVTVLTIVVGLGGAALANKASTAWANVHGIYLWVITASVFVVFVCGIIITAEKLHPSSIKSRIPLDLALTPSKGPSDKMLLAITNNGKGQKFHAQCTALSRRNDPNKLFQKTYDLPWEDHTFRNATIVHGESRNLLIARADENRQSQTAEVSLVERQSGGDKKTVEWSRWGRNKAGPEYDLEVSVFGEGDGEPYRERFTLKCGGSISALELVKMDTHKEDPNFGAFA